MEKTMTKIKAILFDFDDTLGDREEYSHRTYVQLMNDILPDEDPWKKECAVQMCLIYDQHGDVPKTYVRERLIETMGIDLGENLQAYWSAHQCENAVLYPDAVPTIRELRRRGYRTGIITNGDSYNQNQKIDRCDVRKYMDVVTVSGEETVRKPDPKIFKLTAERLGLPCEACAFVGDMFRNDVMGAHEAGMKPVWIWPHGERYTEMSEVTQIRCLTELLNLFPGPEQL